MHSIRIAVLVSLSVILSGNVGQAQWVLAYGQGGTISSFVASGPNLILGTAYGILRSTNSGLTWSTGNAGLQSLSVTALAVNGTNIFAGTTYGLGQGTQSYDGGVYVSTDNGAHWSERNSGFGTNRQVEALSAAGGYLFASVYPQGLFRSTDNGQTWAADDSGLTNTYVSAMIGIGSNVLVGTRGGGVFRSTNNGDTWTVADSGISPDSYDGIRAQNFAIAGGRAFVGTGYHFYTSTDSGAVWTQLSNYAYGFLYSLAVRDTTLFAATLEGVYRSTDYGETWTAFNSGIGDYLGSPQITRVVAARGASLYVGTDPGSVYRANAGDTSWTAILNDLQGGPFMVSTIAGGSTGLFAGVTGRGSFFSADSGASWAPVDGLPSYINSFTVSGADVYAGTGAGVFVSTNNGSTWVQSNAGLADTGVACIAVLGTTLFAGTSTQGVFRSANKGAGWTAASNGLTNLKVQSLSISGTHLFAATYGGGLFRSSDNGTNWIPISSGLTDTTVYALLTNGSTLYAGTWSGVFRSENLGQTWTLMDTSGLRNTHVSALALNGSTLYAGTTAYGIPNPQNPRILTPVPGGVFFSSVGGGRWTEASDPSGVNLSVSCLTASGPNLFAGAGGVWRRPLSEMVTSVRQTPSSTPEEFSLGQNYPNPFNPTTTISYTLSRESPVSLEVYDVLGRRVGTLVNKQEAAGQYKVNFDASRLSSGVYFYRLRAGNDLAVNKMLLVR